MPYFTASISIVGVTLLLMPEIDSVALPNASPKSLRLIGSVVTIQRVRAGSDSLLAGCGQFHVQRHGFGHAVHGEIAQDIATIFAGLFYATTLEGDFGKFGGVEKFGAKQMLVALLDFGIDASDGNAGNHG